MTQEKVFDVLRKLMAHRDSAHKIESFEEAEVFAGKINELLLKHKLTLSEVEMREQDVDDPFGDTRYRPDDHNIKSVRKRVWWQEQLASLVARAHFCRILIIIGSNRIVFVGRESDRQVTVYLYTYLVRMLEDHTKRNVAREVKALRDQGRDASGWKASFMRGALSSLRERFAEKRSATEKAAPGSTALVRAGNQLAEYYKKRTEKTSPAYSVSGFRDFSAGAYEQGQEYGKQIPLRRGVGKSDQKSLK